MSAVGNLMTGMIVGGIVGGIVFASIHYGRPEEIILPYSGLPKYKNVTATSIGLSFWLIVFLYYVGKAFRPVSTPVQ
jgi:hypothetical protein